CPGAITLLVRTKHRDLPGVTDLPISRRTLLASGAALGTLTLWGCGSAEDSKPKDTGGSTMGSAAGTSEGVEMYDASQIEPNPAVAIMNPKGVKDRPIGGKATKVTLIEYASPTCPHCAAFATQT